MLQSLPENSITTWVEIKTALFEHYFLSIKKTQIRSQMYNFRQEDDESLFEACEWFKDLLRLCWFHGLENGLLSNPFTMYYTRMTLDVVVKWALVNSSKDVAYALLGTCQRTTTCGEMITPTLQKLLKMVDFKKSFSLTIWMLS